MCILLPSYIYICMHYTRSEENMLLHRVVLPHRKSLIVCVEVCVCVQKKQTNQTKKKHCYHRHPDTAEIESERQRKAAKETNRLF